MALAIGMGIGIPFPASSIGQAINYATTWPFADAGLTGTPWADVRRTGTATYIDSAGLVATLPDLGGGTYAARITHDPSTLARLGMLVGGQATQYAKTSEDFTSASWSTSALTVSANAATAPDGTSTADLLTPSSSGGFIYQGLATAVAGSTTVSIWLRSSTGSNVSMHLAVNGSGVSPNPSFVAITITPQWQRFSLTVTTTAAAINMIVGGYIGGVGWPSQTPVYAWGAQIESGSGATSYIPNSGTGTAVRVADSAGPGLALTSTALSAAFPGGVTAAFTGVIKYRKAYSVSSNETVFALSAGSSAGTTNLFALRTNGTQAQLVTSAGAGTLSGTLVHDGSTVNKIAYSCDPTYAGSELVTNGDFSTTPGGYTAITTTSLVSGGIGRITSTDTGAYRGARLTKSGVTIGKTYRAVAKMRVAVGSSTVTMGFIGGTRSSAVSSASFVETTVYFVANDTTIYLDFLFNTGGTPSAVGDAFELDDISIKEVGAMSISVNGATAVETTGIAYTGSGVAALIAGSQTYAGSEAMGEMIISEWDNSRTSYITGSSLAALSA